MVVSFLSTSALVQHTYGASHSSVTSLLQCFFVLLYSYVVLGTCVIRQLVLACKKTWYRLFVNSRYQSLDCACAIQLQF